MKKLAIAQLVVSLLLISVSVQAAVFFEEGDTGQTPHLDTLSFRVNRLGHVKARFDVEYDMLDSSTDRMTFSLNKKVSGLVLSGSQITYQGTVCALVTGREVSPTGRCYLKVTSGVSPVDSAEYGIDTIPVVRYSLEVR